MLVCGVRGCSGAEMRLGVDSRGVERGEGVCEAWLVSKLNV